MNQNQSVLKALKCLKGCKCVKFVLTNDKLPVNVIFMDFLMFKGGI